MKKLTRADFQPEPSPVWRTRNDAIEPHAFFLRWWQSLAKEQFGDEERWFETAVRLSYVTPNGEPIGFDYNPLLYRASLGLPPDYPLINPDGHEPRYDAMWDRLMKEERNG